MCAVDVYVHDMYMYDSTCTYIYMYTGSRAMHVTWSEIIN